MKALVIAANSSMASYFCENVNGPCEAVLRYPYRTTSEQAKELCSPDGEGCNFVVLSYGPDETDLDSRVRGLRETITTVPILVFIHGNANPMFDRDLRCAAYDVTDIDMESTEGKRRLTERVERAKELVAQ